MTLSMYAASVPVLIHGLTNLAAILRKAEVHAEAKKIEPAALLGARLYPDMHPLLRQVQSASDIAKGAAGRLAGVERPVFEDTELTFAELQQRIEKTIQFLQTLTPAQIDGSEEKTVLLNLGKHEVSFRGQPYLLYFALPNFYFHLTTAYAILRHNGVEIGKMDFIGPLQK